MAQAWHATLPRRVLRWSRLIARTAKNGDAMASRTSSTAMNDARAALSGRTRGSTKSGTGPVEGIHALLVAKRSARSLTTKVGRIASRMVTTRVCVAVRARCPAV